jgi:uncharacterized heparinase superfamily protein
VGFALRARLSRRGVTRSPRDLADVFARLGPRPALIARYVVHGVAVRVRRRRLRRSYATAVASAPSGATLVLPSVALPLSGELPEPLRPAAERLRAEAAAILEHRFDILGSGLVPLGPVIDWHRDFKSGYRWPQAYFDDVEVTRLTDDSDAKVPWELSRCHHLLTLARAARLDRDDACADEFEAQLAHWLAENPPGYGINWANPMEIALRAVNWIYALATLEQWRPLQPPLRDEVIESLQIHGRHIARNLEGTPYLRSNHYLADILGLLVLGASLNGDAEADRWFASAHAAFEQEILGQVHDDGVGFEASLPYHGLALEMFLIAKATADRRGRPFSRTFDDRLGRMLGATHALRHPDGRLPQFGDADSGRVLPAGFLREPTADHLLWLGAAVFGRAAPLAGAPHEEVAWTFGIDAWQRLEHSKADPPPLPAAFPDSGYYILRGGLTHVVVRCGDVGQNGNGGHAHNDLLSFELSYGGCFVVDSGTYVYTSDPDARNAFRSTAAHNTVAVGGEEINPIDPAALFRLRQRAQPVVELWSDASDACRLVVSHSGYERLSPPVRHRRSFTLDRRSDELRVVDELLGEGQQDAASFVHLAPRVEVTPVDRCTFELRIDDAEAVIRFDGTESVALDEGWVSDSFGARQRGPLLVGTIRDALPLRFGYRISPGSVRDRAHRDVVSAEVIP